MHPLLLYKPVPGAAMQLETITAPTAAVEGQLLFTTNQNQPLLNRITVTITDTTTGAIAKQHVLDFNRRTGFDPTTNAALDTQDTTNPYIQPISFGPASTIYKTEIHLPTSWGLYGGQYAWSVTVADIWGVSTTLNLPQAVFATSPVVSISPPTVPMLWEYPLTGGSVTLARTVSLADPAIIQYSLGGTATAGLHYSALPGSVQIPAGEAAATLSITPLANDDDSGDRSITVSVQPTLLQDWRFQDANGTTLNNSVNSVTGGSAFNVAIANSSVQDGRFHIQRNNSGTSDSYAPIAAVTSGKVWAAIDFTGWSLSGQVNETVSLSLTDQANTTSDAAGVRLSRVSLNGNRTVMRLSGLVNGTGGTAIPAVTVSNSDKSADELFVVLQADFDTRKYEIWYRFGSGAFASLGTGNISAANAARYLRLGTTGALGSSEYFELARCLVSTVDPKITGSLYLIGAPSTATLTLVDRDTVRISGASDAAELPLTSGAFTLQRSGNNSRAADAYFALSGTAQAGMRYTAAAAPLRFTPGQTSKTLSIEPIADNIAQGDQTVTLSIAPNENNAGQDWQFGDANGTTLNNTVNAVAGGAVFDTAIANSSVLNGNFRIRRAATGNSNSWAPIGSRLATGNHWLRVDIAGWNFTGPVSTTSPEVLRFSFTQDTASSPAVTNLAVLELTRTETGLQLAADGGSGGTAVAGAQIATGTTSPEPLTLLLNFDADAKRYRVFYKYASAAVFTYFGEGDAAPTRTAAYIRVGAFGNLGSSSLEFFDINRISLMNMLWTAAPSTTGILVKDKPMDAWRRANFTDAELAQPSISGDLADIDLDGFTTLMEYALRTGPKTPNGSPIATGEVTVNGERYLTISFARRAVAPDLTYAPESASALNANDWSAATMQLQSLSAVDANGMQTAVYRDTMPISGTSQRFARLRMTKN
jgi:hypothetical protein